MVLESPPLTVLAFRVSGVFSGVIWDLFLVAAVQVFVGFGLQSWFFGSSVAGCHLEGRWLQPFGCFLLLSAGLQLLSSAFVLPFSAFCCARGLAVVLLVFIYVDVGLFVFMVPF